MFGCGLITYRQHCCIFDEDRRLYVAYLGYALPELHMTSK